jgi:hypothetical protein
MIQPCTRPAGNRLVSFIILDIYSERVVANPEVCTCGFRIAGQTAITEGTKSLGMS